MPESNKAARARKLKANRAAGIGDETGRLTRTKTAPSMASCTVCSAESKITKTNTEIRKHSENKHCKTAEDCFPGAEKISAELAAAVADKAGAGKGGAAAAKPKKKKKDASDGLG